MQTITIGFSKPNTWKPFAWLIMRAYSTPYDHVYIRIHSDKYERDLIYQASSIMVNFMSPEVFDASNITINSFKLSISDESYKSLMQFCIDNAGKPYGIKDILGLSWVRINDWLGRTVKNPFNDGGTTYVCSELVSTILVDFTDIKLNKDTADMTPLDVYNVMLSLDDKV